MSMLTGLFCAIILVGYLARFFLQRGQREIWDFVVLVALLFLLLRGSVL